MPKLALRRIREAKKKRLTRLELGNCALIELPDELFKLAWLEELILSDNWYEYTDEELARRKPESQIHYKSNKIESLSPNIRALKNLKKLSANSFAELHDLSPLRDLQHLQVLDVSRTQVSDLSVLRDLQHLQVLDVSGTQVSDLSVLRDLQHLQVLDVSWTQVTDLSALKDLQHLQTLKVLFTRVSDLSPLKNLQCLQELNVSASHVIDLSPLKGLQHLQDLSAFMTRVCDLKPLKNLQNLIILDVSKTQVSDLKSLKDMQNLRMLVVSDTEVSDLSPLRHLQSLQMFYASDTPTRDLSPLKDLKNLRVLDVSRTEVSDLSSLKNLQCLQELDVSQTQVSAVSPLRDLQHLQSLNISETQVSDLSPLKNFIEKGIPVNWGKHIRGINIDSCRLNNPPREIVEQGNEAILNYFIQIEEQGTVPLYEAKLIMVGEPGAGKTSLTEKLLDETHKVIPEDPKKKSTLGINIRENWRFLDCQRQGKYFTSHIWDFGGQEIQYMTHQFFLTPESLYVLVADDRKQHTLFPYWFEVIHLLGKDDRGHCSPIIVVLNERNHKSITNFDLNEYRNKYPNTQIDVLEVDLSDENLDRFKILRNRIQQSLCNLEHIGRPLPKMWPRIRESILSLNDDARNHINEKEFAEICYNFGVERKEDIQLISKYLHQLGIILHFQNDIQLRDFIIISPQWALKAVYAVLEDTEVAKKFGKFTDADLDNYWQDLSVEERSKILSLMRKDNFEICYPIGNNTYIAPQLLPQIRPPFAWNKKDSLKCQFFYRFMPKGIITRLIVRKHEDLANGDYVWARGAVFRRFDCDILVAEEEVERNGLIAIEVNGKETSKVRALNFIRDEIEEIHRKWFSNITYEERAPCNCEHCNNSTTPTFFDWKKLIQRLEEGRQTIECDNVRVKDVPVLPLLEGFTDAARIKRSVKPLKRSRGDQRDASIIVNITPPITQAPSVSKPESEEKSINQDLVMTHPQKPRPDIWKKMKIKALMFTGSIAIVWFFLAWAKPGSELKFLELFEVKQGEEQETNTNTKDKVANLTLTVIGSIKLNNRNATADEIKKVYIKGNTLTAPATLSGSAFKLRDVDIPQDKIIEIAVDFKDGSSASALFMLPTANTNNVSDLGEVLIETKAKQISGNKSNIRNNNPVNVIINNLNKIEHQ